MQRKQCTDQVRTLPYAPTKIHTPIRRTFFPSAPNDPISTNQTHVVTFITLPKRKPFES